MKEGQVFPGSKKSKDSMSSSAVDDDDQETESDEGSSVDPTPLTANPTISSVTSPFDSVSDLSASFSDFEANDSIRSQGSVLEEPKFEPPTLPALKWNQERTSASAPAKALLSVTSPKSEPQTSQSAGGYLRSLLEMTISERLDRLQPVETGLKTSGDIPRSVTREENSDFSAAKNENHSEEIVFSGKEKPGNESASVAELELVNSGIGDVGDLKISDALLLKFGEPKGTHLEEIHESEKTAKNVGEVKESGRTEKLNPTKELNEAFEDYNFKRSDDNIQSVSGKTSKIISEVVETKNLLDATDEFTKQATDVVRAVDRVDLELSISPEENIRLAEEQISQEEKYFGHVDSENSAWQSDWVDCRESQVPAVETDLQIAIDTTSEQLTTDRLPDNSNNYSVSEDSTDGQNVLLQKDVQLLLSSELSSNSLFSPLTQYDLVGIDDAVAWTVEGTAQSKSFSKANAADEDVSDHHTSRSGFEEEKNERRVVKMSEDFFTEIQKSEENLGLRSFADKESFNVELERRDTTEDSDWTDSRTGGKSVYQGDGMEKKTKEADTGKKAFGDSQRVKPAEEKDEKEVLSQEVKWKEQNNKVMDQNKDSLEDREKRETETERGLKEEGEREQIEEDFYKDDFEEEDQGDETVEDDFTEEPLNEEDASVTEEDSLEPKEEEEGSSVEEELSEVEGDSLEFKGEGEETEEEEEKEEEEEEEEESTEEDSQETDGREVRMEVENDDSQEDDSLEKEDDVWTAAEELSVSDEDSLEPRKDEEEDDSIVDEDSLEREDDEETVEEEPSENEDDEETEEDEEMDLADEDSHPIDGVKKSEEPEGGLNREDVEDLTKEEPTADAHLTIFSVGEGKEFTESAQPVLSLPNLTEMGDVEMEIPMINQYVQSRITGGTAGGTPRGITKAMERLIAEDEIQMTSDEEEGVRRFEEDERQILEEEKKHVQMQEARTLGDEKTEARGKIETDTIEQYKAGFGSTEQAPTAKGQEAGTAGYDQKETFDREERRISLENEVTGIKIIRTNEKELVGIQNEVQLTNEESEGSIQGKELESNEGIKGLRNDAGTTESTGYEEREASDRDEVTQMVNKNGGITKEQKPVVEQRTVARDDEDLAEQKRPMGEQRTTEDEEIVEQKKPVEKQGTSSKEDEEMVGHKKTVGQQEKATAEIDLCNEEGAVATENLEKEVSDNKERGTNDIEKTEVTTEEDKMEISNKEKAEITSEKQKIWTTDVEKTGFTAEKEKIWTTDMKKTGLRVEKDKIGTTDMKKTELTAEKGKIGTTDMEKTGLTVENDKIGSTDMEKTGLTAEREKIGTIDMEKTGLTVEKDKIGSTDMEKTVFSAEKKKIRTTDMEKTVFTAEKEKIRTTDMEKTVFTAEKEKIRTTDMEKTVFTAEKEKIKTTDMEKTVFTVEKDKIGTTEQLDILALEKTEGIEKKRSGIIEEETRLTEREKSGLNVAGKIDVTGHEEEIGTPETEVFGKIKTTSGARDKKGEIVVPQNICTAEEEGTEINEEIEISDNEERGTSDDEEIGTPNNKVNRAFLRNENRISDAEDSGTLTEEEEEVIVESAEGRAEESIAMSIEDRSEISAVDMKGLGNCFEGSDKPGVPSISSWGVDSINVLYGTLEMGKKKLRSSAETTHKERKSDVELLTEDASMEWLNKTDPTTGSPLGISGDETYNIYPERRRNREDREEIERKLEKISSYYGDDDFVDDVLEPSPASSIMSSESELSIEERMLLGEKEWMVAQLCGQHSFQVPRELEEDLDWSGNEAVLFPDDSLKSDGPSTPRFFGDALYLENLDPATSRHASSNQFPLHRYTISQSDESMLKQNLGASKRDLELAGWLNIPGNAVTSSSVEIGRSEEAEQASRPRIDLPFPVGSSSLPPTSSAAQHLSKSPLAFGNSNQWMSDSYQSAHPDQQVTLEDSNVVPNGMAFGGATRESKTLREDFGSTSGKTYQPHRNSFNSRGDGTSNTVSNGVNGTIISDSGGFSSRNGEERLIHPLECIHQTAATPTCSSLSCLMSRLDKQRELMRSSGTVHRFTGDATLETSSMKSSGDDIVTHGYVKGDDDLWRTEKAGRVKDRHLRPTHFNSASYATDRNTSSPSSISVLVDNMKAINARLQKESDNRLWRENIGLWKELEQEHSTHRRQLEQHQTKQRHNNRTIRDLQQQIALLESEFSKRDTTCRDFIRP